MLAQKSKGDSSTSEIARSTHKNNRQSDTPDIQAELNPVWHHMATGINHQSITAPPSTGDNCKPSLQRKQSVNNSGLMLVQRMCSECEQELENDSVPVQRKLAFGAGTNPDLPEQNSLQLKLLQGQNRKEAVVQRMCAECEQEQPIANASVQPKLTMGLVDDPYEREADHIADQVVQRQRNTSASIVHDSAISRNTSSVNLLQTKCNACVTQDSLLPSLQTKSRSQIGHSTDSLSHVSDVISGSTAGSAVSPHIRSLTEPVLGSDLSGIRVYSDKRVNQAADSINARAFTHRDGIYLGSGQSPNDVSLMAHELTHTVQQGAATQVPGIQRRIVMRTTSPLSGGSAGGSSTGTGESLRILTTAEVESYISDIGTLHHDYDDIISGTGEEFGFVASESYRRGLIASIIRNLHQVSTDLFFDNYQEAVREVRKRALISLIMRASQGRTRGTRPTGYPRACQPAGPRVSQAASSYWIVHPNDRHYWFELSNDGRSNAFEALRTLIFNHQSNACLRTLMHCDYMVSAQQFFVMADTMGETDFNQAVRDGNINLVIRWNSYENIVADTATSAGQYQSLQSVSLSSESDLIIGDHVLFFNHDAFDDLNEVHNNVRGNYSNWRLENAIITDIDASGEFRFQGHGYFSPKRRSEFINDMASKMNGLVSVANSAISAGNTTHLGFTMSGGNRFEVVRPDGAGGWKIYYHQGLGTNSGLAVAHTGLRRFSASDYPNPFVKPGETAIKVRRPIESRRESIAGSSSASGAFPLPQPAPSVPLIPAPSSPTPAPIAPAPAPTAPAAPAPRPTSPAPSSGRPSPTGRTTDESISQADTGQQQHPVSVHRHNCDINESNPVIWFDYNSTNIRNSGGVNSIVHLMMASERARGHISVAGPDARIYLYGFASEEGDEMHNLDLARRRAAVVKSLLEAAGIAPVNLVGVAVGEDTSMGSLAMNRRVEICPTPVIDYIDMPEEVITADSMDCSAPTKAASLTQYAFLIRCLETQLSTTHGPVDILRTLRELYYGGGKFDNAACGDSESGTISTLNRTAPLLMKALRESKVTNGVDVGHIFTGLEGMLCPTTETSPVWYAPSVDMSNEDFLTWGGDIGSAAAGRLNGYNASGWIFKSDPPWSNYFLTKGSLASSEDLTGDIDAFVFRANLRGVPCSSTKDTRMPSPSTPISSLFLDYYGAPPGMASGLTSADRYHCFAEATGGVVSGRNITNKPALVNRFWRQVFSFARLFYFSLGKTHIFTFDTHDLLKLIQYSRDITDRFFKWIDSKL